MQPPEGPPVCTALYCLPSGMPPPIWWMISRSVIPMGTSMRPVFSTRPARAKHLRILRNQFAAGQFEIQVGDFHRLGILKVRTEQFRQAEVLRSEEHTSEL